MKGPKMRSMYCGLCSEADLSSSRQLESTSMQVFRLAKEDDDDADSPLTPLPPEPPPKELVPAPGEADEMRLPDEETEASIDDALS